MQQRVNSEPAILAYVDYASHAATVNYAGELRDDPLQRLRVPIPNGAANAMRADHTLVPQVLGIICHPIIDSLACHLRCKLQVTSKIKRLRP